MIQPVLLGMLGTNEIIIIPRLYCFCLVAKDSEWMRGLGKGVREFNDAKQTKKEIEDSASDIKNSPNN
jgi:sec-independent protein translocase protein TatA